jgi:hypothetical protein
LRLTYQEAIVTNYGNTLTIDFGEAGYWNSKHPFRLKLDAGPLTNLIGDSENVHYRILYGGNPSTSR